MKKQHFAGEMPWYSDAYRDNTTRRARGYFWGDAPNQTVREIVEGRGLIKPESRVLDIGCGDGRHIAYFSSLGCKVVGVDFCPEALQICMERFVQATQVALVRADLTQPGSLEGLGQFDLILDYSVVDHIRREYLPHFKRNVRERLKAGGHLLMVEFAPGMPGLFQNRDYKVKGGHYSRAFTLEGMANLYPEFQVIEARQDIALEEDVAGFPMNAILLQKEEMK